MQRGQPVGELDAVAKWPAFRHSQRSHSQHLDARHRHDLSGDYANRLLPIAIDPANQNIIYLGGSDVNVNGAF